MSTNALAPAFEPVPLTGLSEKLCMAVTRLFIDGLLRPVNVRENALGGRFEDLNNYVADRLTNVEKYRQMMLPFGSFKDKTVLEIGCSSGYLLSAFLKHEQFNAIGCDINPEVLAEARKKYHGIQWVQTTPASIPVPDNTADIIYAIDTMEHLSQPELIFEEAYRILKPGGHFFIYFGPWYGPGGAHLDDIIPFPWPHVFFSMDTLLKVAARIYDSPDHKPACYWIDQKTGKPKPNPYLDRERWRLFLNNITVRQFKRLVNQTLFEAVHYEHIGFGGKVFKIGRAFSGLAKAPVFNEFFSRAVFCVLRKPIQAARMSNDPILVHPRAYGQAAGAGSRIPHSTIHS